MAGPGTRHTLALWREAREWWLDASPREFKTFIDEAGVRREVERALPPQGSAATGQRAMDESHKEEWSLRERKVRDEKASFAQGRLPRVYYERQAQEKEWAKGRGEKARDGLEIALRESAWSVTVSTPTAISKTTATGYAPLHVLTGYATGRSAMLAEEIPAYAAYAGCSACAIADPHSLIGAVEHTKACKRVGIKPLVGASIELPEGGELVLIATSKLGYRNLSQLVSACHLGEPRLFPLGSWERIEPFAEGLLCLTGGNDGPLDRLLIHRDYAAARTLVERLASIFGRERVFIEVERSYMPWSLSVSHQLVELAEATGTLAVAGGAVTHARPEHFPVQDILVCAHTLCTVEEVIGRKEPRDPSQPQITRFPDRAINAERYLRTVEEMAAHFADRPELVLNTLRVADLCEDDVLPERTKLPSLFPDDGKALADLVEANAFAAYVKVNPKQKKRLAMEVERINRLGYASHFLAAWDFCRWAREQGIHMSGRGSLVDSAVAFVLGLSRIDAIAHDLHFDRFLPNDGTKRPDLDLDFEAKRRDDVRGYMIGKYGIERVAAVAAIPSFNTRGIVRQVGKAMGLPDETISYLAKKIHGGIPPDQLESALERRPELRDSKIPKEKFRWVMRLAERMMDIPHGIGLHSSGVVVSDRHIAETVPVMWSASPHSPEARTSEPFLRMIQWDKRSAKHFFDKFDVLCLRGQDVLSGAERELRRSNPDFSAEQLAATTDPEVYRAMRSGELIGIPQSASPAMRQAHVRLRTDNLHDASLVQAGIRPGVGGSVKLNELIARRRGKPYTYDHPYFEDILGMTYGIIVFQEQVDQLLQTFGGYTSGEAEEIRDAIHKRRRESFGELIKDKLIERVMSQGHSLLVAEQVFDYVAGFKGYGFAQGHALAFAEVSLRSVWMMQNHPAPYFAALLSAQPAGYYGPATIANEARGRGVPILGLDVNASRERFEVEDIQTAEGLTVPKGGIRIGFMQLRGLSQPTKARIAEQYAAYGPMVREPAMQALHSVDRETRRTPVAVLQPDEPPLEALKPFGGFFDFVAKVQPTRDELESLILVGAFDSVCPNRRALMWAIPEARRFAKLAAPEAGALPFDYEEPKLDLSIPDFDPHEKLIFERNLLDMDVAAHLMHVERDRIKAKGGLTGKEVASLPPGSKAFVVGNPIRLRFPPTQSGKRVVFFDLEDESGLLNVTCFDETYQRYGHAIICAPFATVFGEVQDRDGYPAFLAHRVIRYEPLLGRDRGISAKLKAADFLVG